MSATISKSPTQPQPHEKKRTTTNGVLAGRLYERLKAWTADCEAELKVSPQEIRERWAKKIKAELDKADPFVRELVEKMMKGDEESPRGGRQ